MPNIVEYMGDHYFVMDIRSKGRRVEYLLDTGEWINAKLVEIVD